MNTRRSGWPGILILVAIAAIAYEAAAAATALLPASKDNTLYEDPAGSLSNGQGQHIFAGTTRFDNLKRRAVLAFDLSGIPPGSLVTSTSLTLVLTKTISAAQPVSLFRLDASWGEEASLGFNDEGGGGLAEPDDATWIHRFFDTTPWTSAGGDFEPTPSATLAVTADLAPWVWSSAEMIADVQGWIDDGSTNFGWIVLGNEATNSTAKRFGSRENVDPALRPLLTVEYTPPPTGAGAVAETGAPALRLTREPGGDLTLSWGSSSCAGDGDYELYAGSLGAPASHAPLACSTDGATSVTLTPGAADTYYLVVPRSLDREGSYGTRTGGIERPPSGSACLPQLISACR